MQGYLTSGATTGATGNTLYQQGLANQQGAFGTYGAALGQQQAALGGQQSYLTSGLDLGTTAMNMYQQQLANKANANQNALSYLSSGQTPYQAGAAYLGQAEGAAANSAQGGPVYNPASLGTSYSGSSASAPQYGLDVGAQSQNYFNSLNNAYGGGGGGNQEQERLARALAQPAVQFRARQLGHPWQQALMRRWALWSEELPEELWRAGGYYS